MVAAPKLERLTVAEAVDRYLTSVRRAVAGHSLSPTTASNYERDMAEFVDLAGADRILDDMRPEDVDDVVLAFASQPDGRFTRPRPGAEPKTRGLGSTVRFRQSVSRLFSEAVQAGWVEASPMPRTVVKPTLGGLTNIARKSLSEAAAEALLDVPAAASSWGESPLGQHNPSLELRDEFLLRLLMEAGPRVSEVCNADQADLTRDDDGQTWLRLLGKGNKERWVPLSATTAQVYARYLADERPEPAPRTRRSPEGGARVVTVDVEDAARALVLTWRGVRMRPRDVQYMVERACKRLPAQVRRAVTPHGLRHTAATLLLASGAADIKTVKELLGHASISTTGLYLDTVAHELAAAVRAHPVTGDH